MRATAIVTGHSRGLGAAIAGHLLARDVRVLGVSRNRNPDLAERFGGTLREIEVDLADSDALTRWITGDTMRLFLDGSESALLVNNAGVLQPIGPLDTQDATAVSKAVIVNVAAPLALSAAFIAATPKARERRILHISSGAARNAYAGWSVYCATKAALDHHARAVVLDRTPRLRIASLAPGVIDTAMQAEIRASTKERFPDRQRFVELKQEGTLKDAGKTGGAVVDFLLSDTFGVEAITELSRT